MAPGVCGDGIVPGLDCMLTIMPSIELKIPGYSYVAVSMLIFKNTFWYGQKNHKQISRQMTEQSAIYMTLHHKVLVTLIYKKFLKSIRSNTQALKELRYEQKAILK